MPRPCSPLVTSVKQTLAQGTVSRRKNSNLDYSTIWIVVVYHLFNVANGYGFRPMVIGCVTRIAGSFQLSLFKTVIHWFKNALRKVKRYANPDSRFKQSFLGK